MARKKAKAKKKRANDDPQVLEEKALAERLSNLSTAEASKIFKLAQQQRKEKQKNPPAAKTSSLKEESEALLTGESLEIPFTISGYVHVHYGWDEDWYIVARDAYAVVGSKPKWLRDSFLEGFKEDVGSAFLDLELSSLSGEAKKTYNGLQKRLNQLKKDIAVLADEYGRDFAELAESICD